MLVPLMPHHPTRRAADRQGAAAVEFAIAATIFFFTLFACFEFGRLMMIESFAEQAAFRSARELTVLGATIDEGVTIAQEELDILGVVNAEVLVEPLSNGNVQGQIRSNTQEIRVRVRIPLNENLAGSSLFGDRVLEREAILQTERVGNEVPTAQDQ